jgi:signal transduction histidine kinase
LAIVKHLAKAHGGEVTVESRFGEGTQFTIELPGSSDGLAESILQAGPRSNIRPV